MPSLPDYRHGQPCVTIKPLAAGFFTLPEYAFVMPVDPSAKRLVPSLCFLIEHGSGVDARRLMFDLGLRSRPENYIPDLQRHLRNRQPAHHRPSASEILTRNQVDPKSVNAVVLSHVHWDHHGDPLDFPNATFFLGHGSLSLLQNGLPGRGSHSHFDPNLFDNVQVYEFTSSASKLSDITAHENRFQHAFNCKASDAQWEPLGPFEAAFDLFQDASVFVVCAGGHLPGHINLLCRTGPTTWTYLAGDVFHDERLLTGEKEVAMWQENGQSFCIHFDKKQAEMCIERIRGLIQTCDQDGLILEVIAAHDSGWYEANKARCFS